MRTITLTEVLYEYKSGGLFSAPVWIKTGECKIDVSPQKITLMTRVEPEVSKNHFRFLGGGTEPIYDVSFKPFTRVKLVGHRTICVVETPEMIKKLSERKNKY